MIYTPNTKKAMQFCVKAHIYQCDKSGIPYVFHPIHVAEQMDDEESTIVALLHDVVEDTKYTLEDLKKEGFSDAVLEALSYLTHDDDVPYMDYVRKIRENSIATKVKLADLEHNSDLSRIRVIREPDDWDLQRVEKYAKAKKILRGET